MKITEYFQETANERTLKKTDRDVTFFLDEIAKEKAIDLDFGYISGTIESWWKKNSEVENLQLLKNSLTNIFLNFLCEEDLKYFNDIGTSRYHISAVCIKNIFTTDSPKLALVVHEALSDLFYLVDINYTYENHKALYLKPSAENYSEWGNGYGDISPHSDDLYEDLDVSYLSLTVCRDQTQTPTSYFFPKNLLKGLGDEDILRLFDIRAEFFSGKNVEGLKKRVRNIVQYSNEYGFEFCLDFRIDKENGERMKVIGNTKDKLLMDKIRSNVQDCEHSLSLPKTGTFLIIANNKVLHARSTLRMNKEDVSLKYGNVNYHNAPRLLFRSKGPEKKYFCLNSPAN